LLGNKLAKETKKGGESKSFSRPNGGRVVILPGSYRRDQPPRRYLARGDKRIKELVHQLKKKARENTIRNLRQAGREKGSRKNWAEVTKG